MYYTEYGEETKLNSMVDSLPGCYSRAHADKLTTLWMTHILLQTILELEFHIPSMFGSTHVVHSFFTWNRAWCVPQVSFILYSFYWCWFAVTQARLISHFTVLCLTNYYYDDQICES